MRTAAETRLEHGTQHVTHTTLDLKMCNDMPSCIRINRVAPLDLIISVLPSEGYYAGGKIDFLHRINLDYPLSAPKVKCLQRIFHPNIEVTGAVCLNILRLDWKPVLAVNAICFGLLMLFNEPNAEEPLNIEAGRLLEADRRGFENKVRECMRGGEVGGVMYDRVLIE